MSKSPAESAEGPAAKNSTTYLTEPLITEDGLTIPPPARPMGPRRLARYYDEVADYLRAVERGDDPLPAVPMFMGRQAPVPKSQSVDSLDQLASLGSIDQEVTSDEPELDFEQTQATVLEDPLTQIGQQIYAGDEPVETMGAYPSADYASPTGDFLGDSAFVPDELPGEGTAEVQSELPHETPADTQVELPELSLPAPVRAVDAQGLDLTELDETLPAGLSGDVTEPATVNSSEQVDRAVDSESSDETEEPLMGDHSSEVMTEESGEEFTAQPTDREVEVADQEETIDTTDETSQSTDIEVASEQADQPAAQSGAMASIIGIVVLVALLLIVWFFFFQ